MIVVNSYNFVIVFHNSIQEEEQVALPHDISSKLPLTKDKNGTQVSFDLLLLLFVIHIYYRRNYYDLLLCCHF